MARPQVNTDLGGPEAIQTTARPVSSAAPTYAIKGSRGAALASALAGIRPELNSYLKEMEDEFREVEEARAYDAIQGMTYDQAKELVASGQLKATESPWYKAAFDKQFGLAHASRRRREIIDAYNNGFDKHSGDIESFLANYAADDAKQYQDNKHIMSGLREGMAGVFGKIKDDNAEFRSGVTRDTASDQFLDVARGAFDRAMDADTQPMETIGALYGQHREMLGLTYAEMDEYVMQLAEERAKAGDVEGARAILEYDRVAEDGTPVGAFVNRAKFSLRARELLDNAQSNAGRQLREGTTETMVGLRERAGAGRLDDGDREQLRVLQTQGAISNEMHESLLLQNKGAAARATAAAFMDNQKGQLIGATSDMLRRGQAYALQDVEVVNPHTGETQKFTARDLIEEAATEQINVMLAKEATPSQVAQHMAEWGVNYTYKPFENAMSYGYLSLTEAVAAAGTDGKVNIPEPAMAGYQTWKAMNNQPRLRDAHIQDPVAGQVFRDAAALERIGRPPEEALMRAASIDRKSARHSLTSTVERNRFESAVRNAVSGGWFGSNAINGSHVAGWIEDSVRVQMDLGLSMREAVADGLKAFRDSHEIINGVAINIRDNFVPPNFGEISSKVLTDFAEQTGLRARDLTIYPSHEGSDYWLVVYKGNLMPVSAEGHNGRFHISQLQQSYLNAQLPDMREQVNEEIRGR